MLMGVVAFMVLARQLSPAHFGVWGLFIIISSIIETLRNAFIRNGFVKLIHSDDVPDKDLVENASIAANVLFSMVMTLLLLLFSAQIEQWLRSPGLAHLLSIYTISLFVLILFSQLENKHYQSINFKLIFWMYFIRNLFFLLAVLAKWILGQPVSFTFLAYAYLISIAAGTATSFVVGKSDSKFSISRKWDWQVWKKYVRFGWFVVGNNLSSLLFSSAHSIMAARFTSIRVVANYNVGSRIVGLGEIPSQVFGDLMYPKATKLVASNDDNALKNLYENTVAASLTVVLPFMILTFVFAKQLILILAGNAYIDAIAIVRVMVLYSFFMPFLRQFGNIMDAKGRPQINFYLMASFAIVNFIAIAVCFPLFGQLGGAIGTLITHFFLFAVSQFMLRRSIHVSIVGIGYKMFDMYRRVLKNAWLRFT
jgi:O-antigen/teichoic acid export membrane protein